MQGIFLYIRIATHLISGKQFTTLWVVGRLIPAVYQCVATSTILFMHDSEDLLNDEHPDEDDHAAIEGLINKLKQVLYNYYAPESDPTKADLHLSTNEIWQQMLKIYPNELFLTRELISIWLHTGGYTFYDFGDLKFEWLLRKND